MTFMMLAFAGFGATILLVVLVTVLARARPRGAHARDDSGNSWTDHPSPGWSSSSSSDAAQGCDDSSSGSASDSGSCDSGGGDSGGGGDGGGGSSD